jgi:hypothetical protein
MKDVNVISLTTSEDEDDENFSAFIEDLRKGNEAAVFLISRKDGTMSVGSTAQSAKDLLWDSYRLKLFMDALVKGEID